MPAPKGNKHAEKWTKKEAKAFVDKVHSYVVENAGCVFIGEPISELGYYRTLWNYISEKFDFDTIKVVETILESRLVSYGIKGDTNATMTIFTLKNNYKWTDKSQIDLQSSDGSMSPPKTLAELYDEERQSSSS